MKNANLIVSIKKIIWIFVFHRQTSRGHKSLKSWTFWACKTSFEKLFSRASRFWKNIRGVSLKKSEKNSSEDRSFFDNLKIFEHENLWRMAVKYFETWLFFSLRSVRFQRYITLVWTKSFVLMLELTRCGETYVSRSWT